MLKNFLIIISILLISCGQHRTVSDVSIFENTKVEELATLVAKEDTLGIISYMKRHSDINIDEEDSYFGITLLMWSIYNDKYNSFIELLKHGADPNFISKNSGETPLIYATNFISERGYDNRYIIELLKNVTEGRFFCHDSVPEDLYSHV